MRLGGAWTTFRGKRLKVWQVELDDPTDGIGAGDQPGALDGTVVATGAGGLRLVEVQPEGKGRQDAAAWRNGARPEPAERFGS